MPKLLNKKLVILLVVLLSVLAGAIFYFLNQRQAEIVLPKAEESEQEKIISRQLKELDELRQKMGVQPLTEKEKQAQIKELEALRKKQIQKPAQNGRGSLNEIERQLEELDKLRLAR